MNGRLLTGVLIFAAAPFVTGCSSMSNTSNDALAGGALGAGAGALMGKAINGKAGQGALIGAGIGTVAGAIVGNDQDQREKAAANARAAQAVRQLAVQDVIRLTQEKQPDEIIINQIRTTNSTYSLTADDLSTLRAGGVSSNVIIEMQNRRPDMYQRGHYMHGQPVLIAPPPGPVYVMPPPPPPPAFGVGVEFRR